MSQTKTYHVERLTPVTIKAYGPDVLKEHDDEAWVRLDTFETDQNHWNVFEWWWNHRIAGEDKTAGEYRLVEVDPYGGRYTPYAVKPSWEIVQVKHGPVAV